MKTINKISFNDIESIPQLVKDFLNQQIEGFENKTFTVDHFRQQIHLKGDSSLSSEQRRILSAVLEEQLSELTLSSKQKGNVADLQLPNTFTVTTGHQLNLFSGPVFFV